MNFTESLGPDGRNPSLAPSIPRGCERPAVNSLGHVKE